MPLDLRSNATGLHDSVNAEYYGTVRLSNFPPRAAPPLAEAEHRLLTALAGMAGGNKLLSLTTEAGHSFVGFRCEQPPVSVLVVPSRSRLSKAAAASFEASNCIDFIPPFTQT